MPVAHLIQLDGSTRVADSVLHGCHSTGNRTRGREPCPRKFPGRREFRELRREDPFRGSSMTSRGLTSPESLPNLGGGARGSPDGAHRAAEEILVLERLREAVSGCGMSPHRPPPGGLVRASSPTAIKVTNVPAGSPPGANVGARVGRSPGAWSRVVPAASPDGGPRGHHHHYRQRPGGQRHRRVATERQRARERGQLGAIWHSSVPGTSPISGLFGARNGVGYTHKQRKSGNLRQN